MTPHKGGLKFRKVALGVAPIAAGILLVAGMAATPWEGGGGDQLTAYYTQLVAHPAQAQIATLLIAFAFLLFVPAFFAMAQVTRHRGTKLGNAGWVLGTIGYGLMAGMAAVIDIYDMVLAQQLGVAEAVALSEQMETLPAVAVVGMAGALGSTLGTLLMAAALWRSREVPVLSPTLMAAGALATFLFPPALVPMTLGASVLLAGLALVGIRILRAKDWETGGPGLGTALGAGLSADHRKVASAQPVG